MEALQTANIIIIDDPNDGSESEADRQKLIHWFKQVLPPRFHNVEVRRWAFERILLCTPLFMVTWGYDPVRGTSHHFRLSWGRNPDFPAVEGVVRFVSSYSWTWMPLRHPGIDSSAWTGRDGYWKVSRW